MADNRLHCVMAHIAATFRPNAGSDAELLERFVRRRDETAFEALVRRHGGMVLGVCRRMLNHEQDAEDAFQATFLVLARRAASVRPRSRVGNWLHGVARRTALEARRAAAKRRRKEAAVASRGEASDKAEETDVRAVLDEELARLPGRLREVIVLCDLEGQTRTKAAEHLGCPEGTVKSRLASARALLAKRLARHGLAPATGTLATALSAQATAGPLPQGLVQATVKAVSLYAVGKAVAAGAITAKVGALTEGVMKAMLLLKLKGLVAIVLAVGAISAAAGWFAYHQAVALPAGVVAEEQSPPTGPQQKQSNNAPAAAKAAATQPVAKPTHAAQDTAAVWPEGARVHGRVLDHRGAAVANAEVLLLGEEHIFVEADRKTWFVARTEKGRLPDPPSARTDGKGAFTVVRTRGTANRLAVISADPVLWVVPKKLLSDGVVEIKLPPPGSLAIHCDLPGKPAVHPVSISLRRFDGIDWDTDVLRFHPSSFSMKNPGDTIFAHLPPGRYAVERWQEVRTGEREMQATSAERQVVTVASDKRATVRFERKVGRPLTGRVRGLEGVKLRYALLTIRYWGPEEDPGRDGQRVRQATAFDVIPITSDGRFTTDPIPPGKYTLFLFAVRASTPRRSSQAADFDAQMPFTVPASGDLPQIEVTAKARPADPKQPTNTNGCVRVLDQSGKLAAECQAMVYTAEHGYTGWEAGGDGLVGLESFLTGLNAEVIDVLVRANGYATSLTRFTGERRAALLRGTPTVVLRRGDAVELRLRLPKGITWPNGLVPEVYFEDYKDRVRMMWQGANRKHRGDSDFNMLNARPTGPGRFELRLTPDTPRFYVAVHAPGFLRMFEAGPFSAADVKNGRLEIDVPEPAGLHVEFDPAADGAALAPIKGVTLTVGKAPRGGDSHLEVETKVTASATSDLRLTDLAPGDYLVRLYTQAADGTPSVPGTDINLGRYFDLKKVTLRAGQVENVRFRRAPLDLLAFRGQRTAVLRIRTPDGKPAAGRTLTVGYFDGHYGALPVFSGSVPASGELILKGLTDRRSPDWPGGPYTVRTGNKLLGQFGFTKDAPTEEFAFSLPPEAGDMAPDVELLRVGTGKSTPLSSFRGKLVCLEFWATWCGPCQPAMEKLTLLAREQGEAWSGRVVFAPVSIDKTPEAAKRHATERGWDSLEHYWAGGGTAAGFDGQTARAFGVSGVPEAFLIGPDGRILWRGHPMSTSDGHNLKARIQAALGK